MRSIWATIILFCLSLSDLAAQQYNFKTWSLEHGLPQSEITSVIQGKKGYLWVGTLGGIAVFDGLHFTSFSEEDGVPSNYITTLYQDREGRTWAGTYRKVFAIIMGGISSPSAKKMAYQKVAFAASPKPPMAASGYRRQRAWLISRTIAFISYLPLQAYPVFTIRSSWPIKKATYGLEAMKKVYSATTATAPGISVLKTA